MTLLMSCRWWLSTLLNRSWDKSLMIGYKLEQFAKSPANKEHVTLYLIFDGQKWDNVNDFPWDIFIRARMPTLLHTHTYRMSDHMVSELSAGETKSGRISSAGKVNGPNFTLYWTDYRESWSHTILTTSDSYRHTNYTYRAARTLTLLISQIKLERFFLFITETRNKCGWAPTFFMTYVINW